MTVVYTVILFKIDRFEQTLSIGESPIKTLHRRVLIKMLFIYLITATICWLPLQINIFYRKSSIFKFTVSTENILS